MRAAQRRTHRNTTKWAGSEDDRESGTTTHTPKYYELCGSEDDHESGTTAHTPEYKGSWERHIDTKQNTISMLYLSLLDRCHSRHKDETNPRIDQYPYTYAHMSERSNKCSVMVIQLADVELGLEVVQ